MSVNKVILIGNLGKDPDIKVTTSGSTICNMSIATSEQYKNKQTGEKETKTEWHRVVLFNRTAEIAELYLKKGSKVYIEGKIQTRKWQDQSGNDVYTTEILGNSLQMLDSRSSEQPANSYQNKQQLNQQKLNATNDFDDDIPF